MQSWSEPVRHARPAQTANLLGKIKASIETGNYIVTKHALERLDERKVSLKDTIYVLAHGYHEKRKTSFDPVFHTWKYSIRGKTKDTLELRVIVSFVEELAIITVIRLDKRKKA